MLDTKDLLVGAAATLLVQRVTFLHAGHARVLGALVATLQRCHQPVEEEWVPSSAAPRSLSAARLNIGKEQAVYSMHGVRLSPEGIVGEHCEAVSIDGGASWRIESTEELGEKNPAAPSHRIIRGSRIFP